MTELELTETEKSWSMLFILMEHTLQEIPPDERPNTLNHHALHLGYQRALNQFVSAMNRVPQPKRRRRGPA